MNINRIIISGNLVADPTLRETNSGTPVASATIANNEFFNDGDGERHPGTGQIRVILYAKGDLHGAAADELPRSSAAVCGGVRSALHQAPIAPLQAEPIGSTR